MSHAESFRERGYLEIRGALDRELCQIVTRYSRFRAASEQSSDTQVPGAFSVYGDPLMEAVEETFLPRLETLIGEELVPTYSYYRIYAPGDALEPHTDRAACEISASVCMGFDPGSQGPGYRWPLFLKRVESPECPDPPVVRCELDPGDVLIYKGRELVHWRDAFAGLWQVQTFLHYVPKTNPQAETLKFDGRPALGFSWRTVIGS